MPGAAPHQEEPHPEGPPAASKKRLFLSWYLDLLFFLSAWGLLAHAMKDNVAFPGWLPYVVFVVVRSLTGKLVGSIGYRALSIDRATQKVNAAIYANESWLTMLIGVGFILEGTKQLVRWTTMYVPYPLFGAIPDDTTQIAVRVAFGLWAIVAGLGFLKLRPYGLFFGLSFLLVSLGSDLLSASLWDSVVAELVHVRRTTQGLPVREGEVEIMQALMPEALLLLTLALLVATASTYGRFKRHAES